MHFFFAKAGRGQIYTLLLSSALNTQQYRFKRGAPSTAPYFCRNRAPDCVRGPGTTAFLLEKCLCPSIENSWIQPCITLVFLSKDYYEHRLRVLMNFMYGNVCHNQCTSRKVPGIMGWFGCRISLSLSFLFFFFSPFF